MQDLQDFSIAQLALESAPCGVMVIRGKQQIIFANTAALALLSTAGLRTARPHLQDVMHSVLSELFRQDATVDYTGADGQICSLRCRCIPVPNTDTTLHYLQDMTELGAVTRERDSLAEELARLSTRDTLTSLPNHKALWQALEPLISRSRRYENPLTLVRLRINAPTETDAAYGQGAHDMMMIKLAQTLRDQVRWADLVGRFDESEFLLILPETSAESAQTLIEKLRERICELRLTSERGDSFSITPLFGVASWQKGDDGRLLLKRAGDRLSREPKGVAA